MEVISIDGTEYVRAAVVAKKHKYTADYIGQLCRAGKVDAKLVGRTWYVNPDSLGGHKNTRYQKNSQNEKTSKINSNSQKSRIDVEAVSRGDTKKMVLSSRQDDPRFLRRIEWKPVKYEVDESELLPPLRQEAISTRVVVDMAEATPLNVSSTTQPIILEAESLPEISLRGKVKIRDVEENFSVDDNNEGNIDISSIETSESGTHIHPKSKDKKNRIRITVDEETVVPADVEAESTKVSDEEYTYEVPVTVSNRGSFTPQAIQRKVVHPNYQPETSETLGMSAVSRWTAVFLVVGGLLLGGAMLSLEKITVASTGEQVNSLHFSLPEILSK